MPFNVKSRVRQAVKLVCEHVDFAGQVHPGDALLALVEDLVEALRAVGEPAIESRHCRLAGGINEYRQDLIDEIVAGAAGNRPRRKSFVAREDLLDQDIKRRSKFLLQLLAITLRVE
jgi:hypothetical protein